ncbi:MAG TPA: Fe-S cluster assembly protein IscX [Bryobacteraceae bacterium]
MKRTLTWDDAGEIALELLRKHPEVEPLKVRFTDLHRWVGELENFSGDPAGSTEGKLEAIQMAWFEEWQDAGA